MIHLKKHKPLQFIPYYENSYPPEDKSYLVIIKDGDIKVAEFSITEEWEGQWVSKYPCDSKIKLIIRNVLYFLELELSDE